MISVIIPTYNNVYALIHYSLPSLLKQTYSNWEALIIDDGSTDGTSEVIKNLLKQDKRLKLIKRNINYGLAASLNLGVNKAKGNIIAILEHDDIWLPKKLSSQIKVFSTGVKVSFTRAIVYDINLKKFTKINDGNLSCFMFTKDISKLIFPIPEENKKYLGIEDGIITARLKIIKAEKRIKDNENIHINTILTIMNSNNTTLSGIKNSSIMMNRYKNVLNLFYSLNGKYSEIDKLLNFWKNHYYFNLIISYLPIFIKKIIYRLIERTKNKKNKKLIEDFKRNKEYLIIKEYRKLFG